MKKVFVIRSVVAAFAASTLFACTQDVTDSLPVQTESDANVTNELPKYRTYEEALAVAQNAIGLLGENSTTRSGKPRTVNTGDVQYVLNSSATRSDDEPDTLMYVFNYEDNAGFAVVSANRATEELIAVTEQGNYVASEETGNGGFDLYMDLAEEYVRSVKNEKSNVVTNGDGPVDMCELIHVNQERIIYSYGPYTNTRWGQWYPYNMYCITDDGDTIAAGCLTAAVAQTISYYEYPAQITIDYDGDSSILPLNWNAIKKHKTPVLCTCAEAEHETIGKMFRQIGEELGINYGDSISGASKDNIKGTFEFLGYTCDNYQPYKVDVVKESLSKGRLVYILGVTSNREGHAWVIDGFKYVETIEIEYSRNTVTGEMTELWRDTPEYNYYNHFNWGWNGDSNGYFLVDIFDAHRVYQLDFGASATYSYDFCYNVGIFPNIKH